jgi:hypothetical protein
LEGDGKKGHYSCFLMKPGKYGSSTERVMERESITERPNVTALYRYWGALLPVIRVRTPSD